MVETVAVRHDGHAQSVEAKSRGSSRRTTSPACPAPPAGATQSPAELQREVRRILALAVPERCAFPRFQHRLDAIVLHPVWGLLLLGVLLFLMFQAVFTWANVPMDAIKAAMAALGDWIDGAHGRRACCAACWSTA